MYRLIALDIDGTLLDPQGEIRPRVRQAIRQATGAGCIVTLATGRRHRSAREVADHLEFNTPLIMYSGSIVYDPKAEQALLHRPLTAEFVRQAVKILRAAGVSPGVFQSPVSGESIFLGPPEYDDAYLRDYSAHPSRVDLVRRQAYAQHSLVQDPLVVFGAGSRQVANQLTSWIAQQKELACNIYCYSLRQSALDDLHGFDLLPPDHTKATALRWLAQYHGLTLAETMVIGDGPNDIEMLRVAGLGVAMGQAAPEVKAAADVIVSSNEEDGVAEAIERFVLGLS